MADNTTVGVVAIVSIVLIVALFLGFSGAAAPSITGNVASEPVSAMDHSMKNAGTCEPDRFCDGSKLVIVNEDCSLNMAYCQSGCLKDQGLCA